MAPRGRATQQSRDTRKSKAIGSLFPIEMIAKLEWTQNNVQQNVETITESHSGSNNQQRINNNRTIALERTAAKATEGLNAFYWYQILALDSPKLSQFDVFNKAFTSSPSNGVSSRYFLIHISKCNWFMPSNTSRQIMLNETSSGLQSTTWKIKSNAPLSHKRVAPFYSTLRF